MLCITINQYHRPSSCESVISEKPLTTIKPDSLPPFLQAMHFYNSDQRIPKFTSMLRYYETLTASEAILLSPPVARDRKCTHPPSPRDRKCTLAPSPRPYWRFWAFYSPRTTSAPRRWRGEVRLGRVGRVHVHVARGGGVIFGFDPAAHCHVVVLQPHETVPRICALNVFDLRCWVHVTAGRVVPVVPIHALQFARLQKDRQWTGEVVFFPCAPSVSPANQAFWDK